MKQRQLYWKDLTEEEQEQATNTFRAIRSFEEGIPEEEVNIDIITECLFTRSSDGYIDVII